MNTPSFYEILGVAQNASATDIHVAYHRLAQEYHPDKHASEPNAAFFASEFRRIHEVYEVLGNPEQRTQYDDFLLRSGRFATVNQNRPSTHANSGPAPPSAKSSFDPAPKAGAPANTSSYNSQEERAKFGREFAEGSRRLFHVDAALKRKSSRVIFVIIVIGIIIYIATLTKPSYTTADRPSADSSAAIQSVQTNSEKKSNIQPLAVPNVQKSSSDSAPDQEKSQENTGEIKF